MSPATNFRLTDALPALGGLRSPWASGMHHVPDRIGLIAVLK